MENLGLFHPGNPTDFVSQINVAGSEGLTGLIPPNPAGSKTSATSEVEQLLTHNFENTEIPGIRRADSTLPSQDLNLTLATVSSQSPATSTDPLTGQAMDQADSVALNQVIKAVYHSLTELADDRDFTTKTTSAFGDRLNAETLEDLRQHWAVKNFEELPAIEIRSTEELKGANGAFSEDTNTIYLSREYVRQNASHPQAITGVLLEEVGHHIDSRINSSDAAGDEGAIFSALVQNVRLDGSALQALKAEDDTATIVLDGQAVHVEQASHAIKTTNYSRPSSGQYRVATWGKDTNSGVPGDPWRTLEKAIASAPSGSTIVVRKGTYREGNLDLGKELTFQPYSQEKVWVKGSLVVNDWVAEGSMWRKDNWGYEFTPIPPYDPEIDEAYPQAGHLEMVFVNGQPLEQVLNKWEVEAGKFYLDRTNDQLYIGTNPSGKTVESTAFQRGINVNTPAEGSAIKGIGFSHYAEKAIHINAPNLLVENSTFARNGFNGVSFTSTDGRVRGNTFSHNGNKGLNGNQADRTVVEGNIFSNNNVENFANGGASGSKFSRGSDLVFRDNIYKSNDGHGLWLDISCSNATIVGNLSRNNQGNGIFFELSHKATIASNEVVNNAQNGISIYDSSSASVYNNTASKNAVNINVGDGSRKNYDPEEVAAGITWEAANNVVENNVLSEAEGLRDDGKAYLLSVTNNKNTANDQIVSSLSNNTYNHPSSGEPESIIRYKVAPEQGGNEVNFQSVRDFALATGYEKQALG